MNMMSDFENTTRLPLARPKGLAPVARRRTRDEVLIALVPVLVGRGLPTVVASALATAVYDGYVAAYGGIPANADHIAKALATPQGKAWLETLAAPHLAAFNAAKAEKRTVAQAKAAPAPVAVAPKAPSAPKVLPDDVQERLTARLRDAMVRHRASGISRETRHDRIIDATLAEIVATCREYGVGEFTTAYANGHPAAALVVGRYLALREELGKFFLHWTPLEEGGVQSEAAPPTRTHGPTIPKSKAAKGGAEQPAETPEQRKARLASTSRAIRNGMRGAHKGK